MIKNVIFDVGKVLIGWDPLITMHELGFSEKDISEIYSALYESGAWGEEDRGARSREEMYDYLAGLCPEHDAQIRLFYSHATDSVTLMPYAHEWIKSLKSAGYKVYILSNFGDHAWHKAIELGAIDFLDLADGQLISYEVRHIKPEPEIYSALLERYSLSADECVFIDDSPANTAGAEALGIKGIIFTGYEDAVSKLAALGVSTL